MAKKKTLRDYTALGSLSAELVLQNLPFVFFLGFLAVIYIANAHFAEKRVREIQELQKEVKDLRRQYNSLESENMFKSRFTELSKSVASDGLSRDRQHPHVVVIQDN